MLCRLISAVWIVLISELAEQLIPSRPKSTVPRFGNRKILLKIIGPGSTQLVSKTSPLVPRLTECLVAL